MLCTECTAIEDGNKLPGAYAIRQPYKCKVREANIVERLFSDKNISLQKQWHATVHTFNVNSVSKPLWQNPMTSPLSFSELRAPLTESELCAIHTNVLRAKKHMQLRTVTNCTLHIVTCIHTNNIIHIRLYIYKCIILYYTIYYTVHRRGYWRLWNPAFSWCQKFLPHTLWVLPPGLQWHGDLGVALHICCVQPMAQELLSQGWTMPHQSDQSD